MTNVKKAVALVAGLAAGVMVFAAVAAPAPAQADATQDQINALLAQIEALKASMGGSSSASVTFTTDLTIGSTGPQVTALQTWLMGKGFAIPAGATGYFGAQTQSALAAYQAANGIVPAAGYFGPVTRAKVNASAGTTTGGTTTGGNTTDDGDLEGDFGTISDVDELGSYNDEEVGEGEEGVKVLGADVEASNDGDISLTAIKVSFDSTGNTGSDNLDDYISGVTIMLGDEEVGSADAEDFSENGNVYSKTISLDGAKISADDTEKLYIAVDASNTFDSSDISGDSWTVDIDSIKFVDGSGDSTTETGYDIDGMDVPMNFVSFSSAADTELKVSTDSDSPDAGIVVVDDSSETDDVSLLKGKLKLEGTSDAVLDEFPVTFTATNNGGSANGVDDIAGSVTLVIDGEEYTETMTLTSALTGTVTFDNLDLDIASEDSIEFEVLADINDLDGTVFVAGATLKADVTSTNRDYMDVENEEGDQLSDSSEKSGTATGEAQEFRVNGISASLISSSAVSNNNDAADTGTFTIKYEVTAIGDSVYIASLAADAVTYAVDRSGTATTAGSITATLVNNSDTDKTSVGNYEIEEGTTEKFTLTVTVPNGTAGASAQYRTTLTGIKWDTSDDVSPANTYSSNLDDFQTDYVYLDAA